MSNDPPCPPVKTQAGCDPEISSRVSKLEGENMRISAVVESLKRSICDLESRAIVSLTVQSDMSFLATRANDSIVEMDSGSLASLQSMVINTTNTINDRIVGGTLDGNGDLSLVRANGDDFLIGNVTDIVNPVRAITIRNDDYIELTLIDGITKIVTPSPIPLTPSGIPNDTFTEFLTTPVLAFTGTSGDNSSVNISALPGVSVPVGATHVWLRCTLEHTDATNANLSQDSYTDLIVSSVTRLTAGHKTEVGDSRLISPVAVGLNETLVVVPLPGNSTISYSVVSNFNGSATTPNAAQTTVRATMSVVGFSKSSTQ